MVQVKECDPNMEKGILLSLSPPISDSVGDYNTALNPAASTQLRMTGPTRRSTKGGWTDEEDRVLADAVEKYNGKNWKRIAECVRGRTDVQCLHRWQKVLSPDLVKGFWSKEEDDLIIELVAKQGSKKWSEIAKSLPGRIGKQCRERWHNHLNPDIKRTAWTTEEELILIDSHKVYGNKWAEIAKFLPGRTENSIKNHWNCSVKKKLELRSFQISDGENRKIKAGIGQTEALRGNLDQIANFNRNVDTSSINLDLVLGSSKGRECKIKSSDKGTRDWLKQGAGADNVIKTPTRNLLCDRAVAAYGLGVDKRKEIYHNYGRPGESHYFPAKQSIDACTTPSVDLWGFAYLNGKNHNPINPMSLMNNGLDASDYNRTAGNVPKKPDHPLIVDRLHESSKGSQAYEKTRDVIAGATEHSEVSSPGCLFYRPLQQEDLDYFLENGKFPSTDSYIQQAVSSVSYRTPPSQERGISVECNDTDSVLSSAARTFKCSPSILRKRRHQISRQSINSEHHIPSKEISTSSKNSPSTLSPCGETTFYCMAQSTAKKLFLSPQKVQKL